MDLKYGEFSPWPPPSRSYMFFVQNQGYICPCANYTPRSYSNFSMPYSRKRKESLEYKCETSGKCFAMKWRSEKHKELHRTNNRKVCHYLNNGKPCPYELVGCKFKHENSSIHLNKIFFSSNVYVSSNMKPHNYISLG